LWKDLSFLEKSGQPEFNEELKHTQFADFHGHGWVFRAVYKRDRKGNLLDPESTWCRPTTRTSSKGGAAARHPSGEGHALHRLPLRAGQSRRRQSVWRDAQRGGGGLRGLPRRHLAQSDAEELGRGGARGGTDMALLRTPWGQRRFYWQDGKLYQRSMVDKDRAPWEVVQVVDTITPGNPHYNEKSRLAKTMLKDGDDVGRVPGRIHAGAFQRAHDVLRVPLLLDHQLLRLPSADGANRKLPMLHNEGLTTRNYTAYNFEVLRDDIYMLGVDGTVTKHRIAPTRSTCAVVVSSQNANRDWIYYMQQTISAEGFSGFGFSTYYPHTVRATETKTCTDCHVSREATTTPGWRSC
jgi:hypothetical protein